MELMDLSEYFDYTDGPEQILKYYCTIIHGIPFIIDINLPIGVSINIGNNNIIILLIL